MNGWMNAWTNGQEDREGHGWESREWTDGGLLPLGLMLTSW